LRLDITVALSMHSRGDASVAVHRTVSRTDRKDPSMTETLTNTADDANRSQFDAA